MGKNATKGDQYGHFLAYLLIGLAFVTGNAKKLEEVKYILSQGNLIIPFKSRALDCWQPKNLELTVIVDEVQGTTQDVAIHKCRQAAEIVQITYFSSHVRLTALL